MNIPCFKLTYHLYIKKSVDLSIYGFDDITYINETEIKAIRYFDLLGSLSNIYQVMVYDVCMMKDIEIYQMRLTTPDMGVNMGGVLVDKICIFYDSLDNSDFF